jgi:hypothetical protein
MSFNGHTGIYKTKIITSLSKHIIPLSQQLVAGVTEQPMVVVGVAVQPIKMVDVVEQPVEEVLVAGEPVEEVQPPLFETV